MILAGGIYVKTLFFDYYMQIDYSDVVSKCNYTIKCIPQSNMRQSINRISIDMFPRTNYSWGIDGLKNRQIYGVNEGAHSTFHFRISGEACTGLADYEEIEDDSMTMIFRHAHGLNVAGERIRAYFHQLEGGLDPAGDSYEKALLLMHRLHRDYQYQPNCTNINTTAEEAFTLGRGVCQDYAHIFISLLHLADVPARYVTGLLIGEGASHAWVEILSNGKWYGLDPTNDVPVLADHIKIGIGRDAGDCMINRGIMHGGGLHTQKIKVIVKESQG